MFVFANLSSEGNWELTAAGSAAIVVIMLALLLLACFVRRPGKQGEGNGESRGAGGLSTRRLVFSSMAVALALVTSMIKFFHLPMGGSITLFSMLFITLIGYWYGLSAGVMAAVSYGLLQLVIDPYILTIPQMLIDYVFAFGALGLSGLFSNSRHGLLKGYAAGVLGRYFFAVLSGLVFFGSYASDWHMSALTYSLLYNASYIMTEAACTLLLLAVPSVSRALAAVKRSALQGEEGPVQEKTAEK
ncbi:MAG: energy-coupled thiamine transporter ThiT [Lachnospiraceae bacterium]|nr:energy-coupled thiamine transporter ThiT [Lachnospiraceae bacterium]